MRPLTIVYLLLFLSLITQAAYARLSKEEADDLIQKARRHGSVAVIKLRETAQAGDPEAQLAYGFLFSRGFGVAENHGEAQKWYRLSAENGHATAQTRLGTMYKLGRGVKQDFEEAVKWYRLAAEQGHADGQLQLGAMYEYGQGLPRNRNEAMKFYRLAAEQGHTGAMLTLGDIFLTGRGETQDFEKQKSGFAWQPKKVTAMRSSYSHRFTCVMLEGFVQCIKSRSQCRTTKEKRSSGCDLQQNKGTAKR